MKEIEIFESWANSIITNEAVEDRPLSRSQDIQYQASKQYPDRSPEQALQLFVAKKLSDNEKTDMDQTKGINSQKRENKLEDIQDKNNHAFDSSRYFFTLMDDLTPDTIKGLKERFMDFDDMPVIAQFDNRRDPGISGWKFKSTAEDAVGWE